MYVWDTRLNLDDLLNNFENLKKSRAVKNQGIKTKLKLNMSFHIERHRNLRVLKGRIDETPSGVVVRAKLVIPIWTHVVICAVATVWLFFSFVESRPLYMIWVVFFIAVYIFLLRLPKISKMTYRS